MFLSRADSCLIPCEKLEDCVSREIGMVCTGYGYARQAVLQIDGVVGMVLTSVTTTSI